MPEPEPFWKKSKENLKKSRGSLKKSKENLKKITGNFNKGTESLKKSRGKCVARRGERGRSRRDFAESRAAAHILLSEFEKEYGEFEKEYGEFEKEYGEFQQE